MKALGLTLVSALTFSLATDAHAANSTLQAVKNKGAVRCGVSTGLPGFSNQNEQGQWQGIDVDLCRAVAAAVLEDASKVKYIPLDAQERFTALQTGKIDLLARNSSWTQTHDTTLGLIFAGINYYDGQGFMVNKSLGVSSALELNDASVCIQSGSTAELNLSDYFSEQKINFTPVKFGTSEQTLIAFETGRCDVLSSDQSQLYALRSQLADPSNVMLLPEVISKEPLGPVVRQGDSLWHNIVKWSLNAMINAEELGLSSANIDEMKANNSTTIRRFIGLDGPKGAGLGLKSDWSYQIVKQVGSYGESFERNLGQASPLKISRGVNALWNKGGFLYAPPMR